MRQRAPIRIGHRPYIPETILGMADITQLILARKYLNPEILNMNLTRW
jgi:hypothetical protein